MDIIELNRLVHTPIKQNIGCTIHNTKEELLCGNLSADLQDLLEQRGVLVFPQIEFTDAEQVAFTKMMGQFLPEIDGEEVYNISLDSKVNRKSEYLKGSLYWHIDGTMNKRPIGAAILSSKKLPTWGGNTEFCNTYAAYEALDDDTKRQIEHLHVAHSAWTTLFYYNPEPDQTKLKEMMAIGETELPLVWTHKSGRKSLVLGATAHHVIGMNWTESASLLNSLREWATSESFRYSHEWKLGDAVMWDNTGTMHRAMPYDPDCGRLLRRTKTAGVEPII